jgi:glucose-1-phosphate cytidylyltransferase
MKTVILAGGFGTRLAEHTDELPKPMVDIGGGRPILWHILKIYSQFGFNDFIIAAGYRSEVIKRFFMEYRLQMSDLVFDFTSGKVQPINTHVEPWRVAVIDTGEQTATGGRLRRLREQLVPPLPSGKGPGVRAGASGEGSNSRSHPSPFPKGEGVSTFMMTYGDGVADIDLHALLRFHKSHGKLATFTAVQRPSQYGVPTLEGDRATSFAEKPSTIGEWISAGFFVLESAVLDAIVGDTDSFELHTLPKLAREGQLMAYRHTGFWHPMDTLRDVRKLNTLWAGNEAPWKLW